MNHSKVVELTFFYICILATAYILWLLFSPYFVALTLAAMLVLMLYPVHSWLSNTIIKKSPNSTALLSTLIAYIFIVAPISFILFLLTRETVIFYEQLQGNSTFTVHSAFEYATSLLNSYFPGATVSISEATKAVSAWGASQLQSLFSSILTFSLTLFVSIMATFFFFRDGKKLVAWIVSVSPLPEDQDLLIANRIHVAVRSVLTGIILISLLQGFVAGIGFWIFGIPKPVLWGTVATLGGLLPGIGTTVLMVPAVIFLYVTGNTVAAIGLLIWALVAVIVIDNILSPILMSRGNALHPLLVLLSILGGISLFGMIGVIVGPVMVSIFLVLLELQKKIVFEGISASKVNFSRPKHLKNKK